MNILNKLTLKHLMMNKKRTIVTIVGIILSTALMCGIGLLLSSVREMMIDEIKQGSGDYHALYKDIDSNKIDLITKNINVKESFKKEYVGYSKAEGANSRGYLELFKVDKNYLSKLTLKAGRLPENNNEIVMSEHIRTKLKYSFKMGDTITLALGDRKDDTNLLEESYISDTEYIDVKETKEYKIVGVVERDNYESNRDPGFSIFTYDEKLQNPNFVYVTYIKPKDAFKVTDVIAKNIGLKPETEDYYAHITTNDSLIAMYGSSKMGNMMTGLIMSLSIMLIIVAIGCIIVIYNSFAISVMERKKQFGLFSSIGATKKQIRLTVIYEAILVSIIGIPLGIISSYIGIGILLQVLNSLIGNTFWGSFRLVTYPLFLIIPVLFMLITIFISAIIPARKASKISPIEAIRLNDDIKIKGKKVKSNKLIHMIFGTEGDLALKNMKRNKKKYRITVISLFISIVMFISFSGFMNYFIAANSDIASAPNYNASISYARKDYKNNSKELLDSEYIDSYTYITATDIKTKNDIKKYLSKESNAALIEYGLEYDIEYATFIIIDDTSFNNYLKLNNFSDKKPVLFNSFKGFVPSGNNSATLKTFNKFTDSIKNVKFELSSESDEDANNTIDFSLSDFYVSNKSVLGIDDYTGEFGPVFIVNEELYNSFNITNKNADEFHGKMFIKSSDSYKLCNEIESLIKDDVFSSDVYYVNVDKERALTNNLLLAIRILVYGFIALVTLIGITSVFNTITTSYMLRKKEFAVLRSVGLTPKGFNKIVFLESLFFGLKALIYAIPVSIFVIFLLSLSFGTYVQYEHLLIPYSSILMAIIGTFIVVGISMMYSSNIIKKENILESIRQENI